MGHHDEHLPADLQDIGARLSAARANPTELELDELRRRAHRQARQTPRQARRGLGSSAPFVASSSRSRSPSVCCSRLESVSVSRSSHSAVTTRTRRRSSGRSPRRAILTGEQGNNGKGYPTNPGHPTYPTYPSFPHANICQYLLPHEHDYEFKTKYGYIYFFLVWDCRLFTGPLLLSVPFKWEYNNWGWNSSNSPQSYTVTPPTNASSLTVNVDGQPYTVPLAG